MRPADLRSCLLWLPLALACSPPPEPPAHQRAPASSTAQARLNPPDIDLSAPVTPAGGAVASASAAVSSIPASPAPGGAGAPTDDETIEGYLYPEKDPEAHQACAGEGRGRCLIARRYTGELRDEALSLLADTGTVLGLEPAAEMDGGYRGTIQIAPQMPTGKYRPHLGWVTGALRDFSAFFRWLGPVPRYRWQPIGVLFFRSVRKRTPAAYASEWRVAYNVEGGINTSADEVRDTLFHEIFHLNDAAHGEWSAAALGPIRDGIVARCGARTPCLRPYAPGKTMVRGGTYYAFQPGNGVAEFAAELALRYHTEQRLVWQGKPVPQPFKCGPEENRRAWSLLVDEFFAGIDRVPDCPRP